MNSLSLPVKLEKEISAFLQSLGKIYQDNLLSVILYGSAASREFVAGYSNLNMLVVLKSDDLEMLKKASLLVKKFKNISALFFSHNYILSSIDIFPIEFLDMQDNYVLLYGKDILKGLSIDLKNLRFQCEQELKLKLIYLKQLYLKSNGEPDLLKRALLKGFTSITHILRSALRLKDVSAAYKKDELLKMLSEHFKIDLGAWEKILAVKNQKLRVNKAEIEKLFIIFVGNLEKIVQAIDAL
jgi:hypothetical protein